MGCIGICLPALTSSCHLKKTAPVSENYRIQEFSKCSPNQTGASSPALFVTACCTAVQSHCTSFPNIAICETADHSQSATAYLGCRFVCTASWFAQKKDATPVGGRGISAFSSGFFSLPRILGCRQATIRRIPAQPVTHHNILSAYTVLMASEKRRSNDKRE